MTPWLTQHPPTNIALIDAATGRTISYSELADLVTQASQQLQQLTDRCLVFLDAANTPDFVISYLACLTADFPVCLLDGNDAPSAAAKLIDLYCPTLILSTNSDRLTANYTPAGELPQTNYQIHRSTLTHRFPSPHPSLSLLLPTSGSTGNPKLVKLTLASLQANAASISEYLGLSSQEAAIQSLPLHYSYGLSLLNSHLHAGGRIVLTPHSFMRPEFWQDATNYSCTSFAGVPYMYETLHRLRFSFADHPHLQTFTQAGGGLRADIKKAFALQAQSQQRRFVVMYGQTEATARIAYVPPDRLLDKLDAIGIAIPQGQLQLEPVEGSDLSELVYVGANVMMGYAESAESLAIGDELQGRLKTGDLAIVDDEGFFQLQGRLKRFAKLFGKRVSLDDVETDVELSFNCRAAAVESTNGLTLFFVSTTELEPREIKRHIATKLAVTPVAVTVKLIEALPMTSSGKKDYKSLEQ
jgi:long-chain acyl-CoA synthetase